MRNPRALAIDYEKEPPMFKVSDTHYAATWLLDERAPKTDRPAFLSTLTEKTQKDSIYDQTINESQAATVLCYSVNLFKPQRSPIRLK